MSEDQPERVRVWSLKEAGEIVALQVQIDPELLTELVGLTGGESGLFVPILDKVADSFSLDPTDITASSFRKYSGAPDDPKQLDAWRITLLEDHQATLQKPQRLGLN